MTVRKENPPVGLTSAEAAGLLKKYGPNVLIPGKKESLPRKIFEVFSEPMFLLLIAAAVVYFLLGEPRDGAVMLVFVLGMIGIDFVQEWKTDRTIKALKSLSAPKCTVLRDGAEKIVPSGELVPGDLLLLTEGLKIPADGIIVRESDLRVDESSLTGEAEEIWKHAAEEGGGEDGRWRKDFCYAGTLVTQGSALVRVEKTGAATEYGKIGVHIAEAPDFPTPLQKQTRRLVAYCGGIAAVLLILAGTVTWLNLAGHSLRDRLVESVLSGVTLAMALIPEEFPVILTVFLSMGAWRLARKHSLVRRLPAVETLGAVSVLCVDKTGTITENRMTVAEAWVPGDREGGLSGLLETMGLACETETYDPMERAMLDYCGQNGFGREELFRGKLLREYSFTNQSKRMGHVWERDGRAAVAAKGSPERILELCAADGELRGRILAKMKEMSGRALRVIAVARERLPEGAEPPEKLSACALQFCGLVGLSDPPRASVAEDIRRCTAAGVRVVMITGDNGVTASAVAGAVGIPDSGRALTGDELDAMDDAALREAVRHVNIFARVVPEHKMRIVKALRANGEVVAMTGDGVNDAPALKYADIGIAMGRRGSEVAREAADLVLLDDNFTTIVDTVRDGRRIYDNIRKAFGYVISIHIPIAFSSLLAPMLRLPPAALMLLPLHIVLLELLIDPTCSVVFERQPAERDVLRRPPRRPDEPLVTPGSLMKSLAQGLALFFASFGAYFFVLHTAGGSAELARSFGISIIFLSNLLLVVENCSRTDSALRSFRLLARDRVMWAVGAGTLLALGLILYSPLQLLLRLAPLSPSQLLCALGLSAAAVLWYELVKLARALKKRFR